MNLGELIEEYRDESHDHVTPPFVSDERLARLATQGQNEACRRGNLITDSTSDFCTLSVTAGDPLLELDPLILDVTRVRLSSTILPLPVALVNQMDEEEPGWEDHFGSPTHYIPDYQTGYIRLYPIPLQGDTARITVARLPLNPLVEDGDEPEIRLETHPALVQWMLHRAYATQDSDMFDANKSAAALVEFEKEFGKKKSARNESWQRERNTISANPIA
jgi:hypothetical protein